MKSILILLFMLVGSTTLAEYVPFGHLVPPKYLFHWCSQGSMEWMAAAPINQNPNQVPLQTMDSRPYIARIHKIAPRPALFAWSHPLFGMGISTSEFYAKSKTEQDPPRLLVMKIKANARILELSSSARELAKPLPANINIENYDLIYHSHLQENGKYSFREWVVLNKDAVEDFTFDPTVGRAFVAEAKKNDLDRPEYKYFKSSPFDMIDNGEDRIDMIRNAAEKYLNIDQPTIPSKFRRPFNLTNRLKCQRALLGPG